LGLTGPVGDAAARAGALWLVGGMASYAAMDVLTRATAPSLPASWVLVVRFAVHAVLMTLVVGLLVQRAGQLAQAHGQQKMLHTLTHHTRSQVLRGVALFGAALFSVKALQGMPVAEYTAIIMVTPLVVTVLAVAWLGQRVLAIQAWLIVAGFVGALVVIRPGSGLFDAAAIVALGVVMGNAIYFLLSSRHGPLEDPWVTSLVTGLVGLVLAMGWLLLGPKPAGLASMLASLAQAGPSTLLALLGIGVLATAGQCMVIVGLSKAPLAALMPFSYLQIPMAVAMAWALLGDRPDAWGWAGLLIILGCGVLGAKLAASASHHGPTV
jgi:drug/metabolite transporter (DMT)-like permease